MAAQEVLGPGVEGPGVEGPGVEGPGVVGPLQETGNSRRSRIRAGLNPTLRQQQLGESEEGGVRKGERRGERGGRGERGERGEEGGGGGGGEEGGGQLVSHCG
uniref:Uncharacterized protein n=1 Tax=Knipowitschia caucasica TaxID=637954 RepID=A0AAV2LVZ8_KNICA